uniref:integrase core domain-containing protein n=2 Tax=Brachyspira pilosicoli TaxID=52584 RepID=UPI0012F503C4
RVYSPVASPWYNGIVESTHKLDQKEFYNFCTQELTLEKANLKLRKYNNFFNYKRIHSALNYDTPMLYFKKLRNT